MNKILFLFLFLSLIVSCDSNKVQINKTEVESIPIENSTTIKDFNSLKRYLVELKDDSLSSIPLALSYINNIPTDDPHRDSILFLFEEKFYKILTINSRLLETENQNLAQQMESGSTSKELNDYKQQLSVCGIDILKSEGMYYLGVKPTFLYDNFKDRVSTGVQEYLNIRKEDLKRNFADDAALLISFEDLFQRVKRWEIYMEKFPNNVYSEEVDQLYKFYLEVLIRGMDNTPIFDRESDYLLSEVKTLYEKIIREEPDLKVTKVIDFYYNLLRQNDFMYNSNIRSFWDIINLL